MNIGAHPELLELLAASHALGTLRGGARRRFEAIARDHAPVRAAALVWQSRLASMTELQKPVVPDTAVWTRIRNQIGVEQSEQAFALHQCLEQLEGRQREVVSLAYLRDLSHGELADRLQLPLGTVKTWIRRGLEKLRACMGRIA